MPIYDRSVHDVAESLRRGRSLGRGDDKKAPVKCCLLIGAGCSVSAGVPLARDFSKQIKKEYPHAYDKTKPETYAQCMAALSRGERYALIRKYIDRSEINPAHLAIAQLIKNDYVDRVLTTNFDPLVSRACSLISADIASYDFAAAQTFVPGDTHPAAVFHLHGQHSGFRLLNTDEECRSLREAIRPLFEDSAKRRIWIVAGYSGNQDPVFEQLSRMESFEHRLYWVCHNKTEPDYHVRSKLLHPNKYAFYVQGYDADSFFTELAAELDCYPPDFMVKPFSHLQKLFKKLKHDKSNFRADQLAALRVIESAKEKFETEDNLTKAKLDAQFWLDDFDGLIRELSSQSSQRKLSKFELAILGRSYVEKSRVIKDKSKTPSLLNLAFDSFATLSANNSENAPAFLSWGMGLMQLVGVKTKKADKLKLLTEATKKYEVACKLDPENEFVWVNKAISLVKRAELTNASAENIDDIIATYDKSLAIKPDYRIFNSKAIALLTLFHHADSTQQASILEQAEVASLETVRRSRQTTNVPELIEYNRCCCFALMENYEQCKLWFIRAKKKGRLPSLEHIKKDKDLRKARRQKWLREEMESMKEAKTNDSNQPSA